MSILLNYIPPLVGAINRDNIPRDFKYTLITAYILKGICVEGSQLRKIPTLKNNDFNRGDRKNYAMLMPQRYLKKMNGKKPRIVSQPRIKEIVQSTILNMMNTPPFGQH
jgi:hypothetical protein